VLLQLFAVDVAEAQGGAFRGAILEHLNLLVCCLLITSLLDRKKFASAGLAWSKSKPRYGHEHWRVSGERGTAASKAL
jgi:hypothetical protein